MFHRADGSYPDTPTSSAGSPAAPRLRCWTTMARPMPKSYDALATRHRRLFHLQHVEAITSWDEAAMMPPGGGDARAEALATLRVLCHELGTDPALGDLLASAEAEAAAGLLDDWQRANLREMKRQ